MGGGSRDGRAHAIRSRRDLLPWVAGGLSLIATIALIIWTGLLFDHDRAVTRERHAATVTVALDQEMARYTDLLDATKSFWAGSQAPQGYQPT